MNDSEAQNFGVDEILGHDERYDRADEFLEATVGLWDTWEDDALVLDRESGHFAHADKVRALDHDGKYFKVKGPLTVPRGPQGRPVLLQAGSSGRGRDFASRWAEVIFTGDPNIDGARKHYEDQKARIAEVGRDPERIKMLPMAYAVVAETRAQAEDREQLLLNDLVDPQASITLLSELMNYDFSGIAMDQVITDELIESVNGIRGLTQNLREHIGGEGPRLAGREGTRRGHFAGQRRPSTVDLGTPGEMVGRLGHSTQQRLFELRLGLVLQGRIEPPLVADRADPHRPHRLPAEPDKAVLKYTLIDTIRYQRASSASNPSNRSALQGFHENTSRAGAIEPTCMKFYMFAGPKSSWK